MAYQRDFWLTCKDLSATNVKSQTAARARSQAVLNVRKCPKCKKPEGVGASLPLYAESLIALSFCEGGIEKFPQGKRRLKSYAFHFLQFAYICIFYGAYGTEMRQ